MLQAYIVYLSLMTTLVIVWHLARPLTIPVLQSRTITAPVVCAMAVSVLLFGLVLGLRHNVGGDYEGYVEYYLGVTEGVRSSDVPYEWGFYWLIRALREFQFPPAMLFLVTCALQMLFMANWMRRYPLLASWYVYFFFTSLLVFESMNTVRQALAYSMLLSAMPELVGRRFLRYVLLVGGASLVHSSSLLFIPLYFLLDRDWLHSHRIQMALLLMAYFVADEISLQLFELLPFLSITLNYGGYASLQDALFFERDVSGFSPGLLFMLLVDLFIMLSAPMLKRQFLAWGFRVYYNLFVVGALLTPFAFYANYIPFARLLFCFTAFKPVVLAFTVFGWIRTEEKLNRKVMRLSAVAFVLAYLLWFLMAIWNKAAWCAPFQFVWQ